MTVEPLTEADLGEMEEEACSRESALNQMACRLLIEVRRLRHELADPSYLYAGGRIHRHAIVCRDQEIDQLRVEIKALKDRLPGSASA